MNAPTRPTLAVINGHATTTSNQIAEHFGKPHRSVLRAIANLECSPDFRLRNFVQASVEVAQPNGGMANYPAYTLTRDGFVFLAMGFTGKEAAQWKEAYIEAFNAMESALQAAPATPKPKPRGIAGTVREFGLSCAEFAAFESIKIAEHMLAEAGTSAAIPPARVALYTASISLLSSAGEILKEERARLCHKMAKMDDSAIGEPDLYFSTTSGEKPIERVFSDNGKEYTPPAVKLDNGREYAPRAAVEGGAA